MRLRIETTPPLPRIKTWFSVPSSIFGFGKWTINDLRKRIIIELGLPEGIQLQLNEYDLLGGNLIEDLLEKDDLITVILREETGSIVDSTAAAGITLGKRKRSESIGDDAPITVNQSCRSVDTSDSEEIDESLSSADTTSSDESSSEDSSSSEESTSSEDTSEDESNNEHAMPTVNQKAPSLPIKTGQAGKLYKLVNGSAQAHFPSSSTSSSSVSSESDSETSSTSSSSSSSSTSSGESSPPSKATKINGPLVPPGQGSERTRLRNQRKARVNRLKRLIAEGTLASGSTLADLSAYEEDTHHQTQYSSQAHQGWQGVGSVPGEESEIMEEMTPRRVDLAVVNRFIEAGLVGNDTYHRESVEVRVRGQQKAIIPEEPKNEAPAPERPLVPRTLRSKKKKTTNTEVRKNELSFTAVPLETISASPSKGESQPQTQDPLISGFYEQVRLATQNRQARHQSTTAKTLTKSIPDNVTSYPIIRAFECEPEYFGLVEVDNDEQQPISVEIDPPSLPFVDTYQNRRQSKSNGASLTSTPNKPITAISRAVDLSEDEIYQLPVLRKPFEGATVYFKSVFLHPVKFEPILGWRWGVIVKVDRNTVTVDIQGPELKNDEKDEEGDVEEGEVQETKETLAWSEMGEVRYQA